MSLEASYIDFGKAKYDYVSGAVTTAGRLEASAMTLAGAWRHDFAPEFTGVARLGLAYVGSKVREDSVLGSTRASSRSTKPYWGLGAEYTFNRNWRGVLSADFTTGKFRGTNSVLRLYSLGALYAF